MIWLLFILTGLAIGFVIWRSGSFDRSVVQLLGAALLVAAAGYIWQGRPGLPGRPLVEASDSGRGEETAFAVLRPEFFERFDTASRWLIIADSYQRRGKTADAVGLIQSAIRAHPDNLALWTGLGNALVMHGGGMNPAANLAYRRASSILPKHPAPRFFYGLNLIQSGQIEEGEAVWRQLLAQAPADAKWRPVVADRLAMIDRLRSGQALPR